MNKNENENEKWLQAASFRLRAEGYSRLTKKDKLSFLYISSSSLAEVETQRIISSRLGYVNDQRFQEILKQIISLQKQISSLQKKIRLAL